jgi:hypothetical protein
MAQPNDPPVAGLVVRLDTDVLRARGDAECNAERNLGAGAEGDRAVRGVHDILIVGVDHRTALCTAVPLFGKSAVGNQPLEASRKSGDASWRSESTWFSRWQHWRIPQESLQAARVDDGSDRDNRRRYAVGDGPALDDIKSWESRNRAPYRRVTETA